MPLERLDHLPDNKRRELYRVARILFDEFEEAQKGKLSEKKKGGRILKLILFGSYARGDWVEDRKSGYRSDYDLLVVVNKETFADPHDYWDQAADHLLRELTVTKHLETPVNFIVHSLMYLNDQLAHGRPFFVDIARDGIMIYEAPGFPLVAPKPLAPEVAKAEARRHFDHWFPSAERFLKLATVAMGDGFRNEAAFLLHQTVERLYHCVLLVVTLYSPKSHKLMFLRSHAERIDARLIGIWPRDTRFAKRGFARLDRAYLDARYSPAYEITGEELTWLVGRVKLLQEVAAAICAEHLDGSGSSTTGA